MVGVPRPTFLLHVDLISTRTLGCENSKKGCEFRGTLAPSDANTSFLYVLHPRPTYTNPMHHLMASHFRSAAGIEVAKFGEHVNVKPLPRCGHRSNPPSYAMIHRQRLCYFPCPPQIAV